jgi:hypothetical protein
MPQEQVSPFALTTLARVKDRLQITINDFDFVLNRMINATSAYIERQCAKSGPEKYPNDGHFVKKTYTNEIYSIFGNRQQFLVLRNAPVSVLTSFQWRAGQPSTPFWTDFTIDQYELVEDGTSGIVRVYGAMPRVYSNMVRATYTAGFPVDWQNAGNGTTHLLPDDLTNTCENIVVRTVPIRSGYLVQNWGFDIGNLMARWYPKASYAPFVEFGTAPHEIRPVNARVLANKKTGEFFGTLVHHPGTKANPFMERIVASAQPEISDLFVSALDKITAQIAATANG